MVVQKVIKVYFAFMMAIVATAGLSYSDTVQTYWASTLHAFENFTEQSVKTDVIGASSFDIPYEQSNNIMVQFSNKGDFAFDMEAGASRFGYAGEESVNFMNLVIGSANEAVELDQMSFQVASGDFEQLGALTLVMGEETWESEKSGDMYEFNGIGLKLDAGEKATLQVMVSLAAEARVGDKFNFVIEDPSDMKISVNGKRSVLPGYFPRKAGSITVVKARPSQLGWSTF